MFFFRSYKGRDAGPGQKVKVYRNLHGKAYNGLPVYSVMDASSRLVLGHTQCILLSKATFEVSEKGRKKVLDSGRKNVHAYVVGHWTGQSWNTRDYDNHRTAPNVHAVRYNPADGPDFVTADGTPVHKSNLVSINHRGAYAHIEPKELSK